MNDQQDEIPFIDREEDPNGINPDTVEVEFKRLFNCSNYYYKAQRSDTIGVLKLHYENAFKVNREYVYFFWNWRLLENHQPLSYYGFREFADLNVYTLGDFAGLLVLALLAMHIWNYYSFLRSNTQ